MRTSRSILFTEPSPVSTSHSARPRSNRFRVSDPSLITVKESLEPPKVSKLKQISTRLLMQTRKTEVTPEVAAKVVRSYILPLFESETRSRTDTLRAETFRHKRVFSTDGNTVYSELKLSEKLGNEMQTLESRLIEMTQVLKDNTQEKEKVLIENQRLQIEILDGITNLKVYMQDNLRLQRELAGVKLSIGHLTAQLNKYKSLCELSTQEQQKLGKQVTEEKSINDIRLSPLYFLNSLT